MAYLDSYGKGLGLDALQRTQCPHCQHWIETFQRLGGAVAYSVRVHMARCQKATPEEREAWKRTGRWGEKRKRAR